MLDFERKVEYRFRCPTVFATVTCSLGYESVLRIYLANSSAIASARFSAARSSASTSASNSSCSSDDRGVPRSLPVRHQLFKPVSLFSGEKTIWKMVSQHDQRARFQAVELSRNCIKGFTRRFTATMPVASNGLIPMPAFVVWNRENGNSCHAIFPNLRLHLIVTG